MRSAFCGSAPYGIAQIDGRCPKVALLQRLTGIGKVIGVHRRRQNAEPDGQQKPAELLHAHAMLNLNSRLGLVSSGSAPAPATLPGSNSMPWTSISP